MNYNGLSDGRGGSVGASFPTDNSKFKPGTKGIPTKEYDRSQLSKKELSDNYVATVTDVMNEVFVVEGGTCECNKGIDPAKIKNTQSASTSFGGKKALTVSCVKMEGEIFGACKKLTEENDKKKGKKCPPIMCKGKFKPVPDKWLDPVASVSSNGEEVIAVYSKLKCEHGGTIHITRNGQGGLYDQGYVNFEVSKELAWAFTPFAVSGYQLYTGRNMNDWSVMTKTETGIQVAYFILDGVIVFSVGKKMLSAASKSNKVLTSLEIADGVNSEFGKYSIEVLNRDQARIVVENILENGEVSLRDLQHMIPENISNTFMKTDTLKNGAKYEFQLSDGQKAIIRWHEPDPIAAVKFPDSSSGSRWTAQIKIGNKQVTVDGLWTKKQNLNEVHIPIQGR